MIPVLDQILTECRRFAKNEIRPQVLENDLSADPAMVRRICEKSREMELPVLCIPEAHGGAGMDAGCCAMAIDLLAAECAGIAMIFAAHFAACMAISAAGAEQQALIFKKIAAGHGDSGLFTLILPASAIDGDPLRIEHHGNAIVLNGKTPPVPATLTASGFVVFANDLNNKFPLGVWIDKSAPGLSFGKPLDLSGLKSSPFAPVTFRDVRIEEVFRLGQGKTGEALPERAKTAWYGFIAAATMGCARTAMNQARDYAAQRYQYGNTIIHHQEIQRMLGDMRMKLDAGTAAYLDLFADHAARPGYHSPDAGIVKAFCTDAALDIVLDAIQIHGGYGYMHEYGVEKRMRDISVLRTIGGTNPYLKVRHVNLKCLETTPKWA